jgi:hypothetical protein
MGRWSRRLCQKASLVLVQDVQGSTMQIAGLSFNPSHILSLFILILANRIANIDEQNRFRPIIVGERQSG